MKGIKTKLKTVFDNIKELNQIIKSNTTLINDVMSHLRYLDISSDDDIYEFATKIDIKHDNETDIKKQLCKILMTNQLDPQNWMRIKSKSSLIYKYLEDRGINHGYKLVHTQYDLHTFSGRSRATKFNIQGTNESNPISHPNPDYKYFVHLDWMAADIRMAGLLSEDNTILDMFHESDPYTHLSNVISNESMQVSRSECKSELIMGLYSLDFNNPIICLFPKLRSWIIDKIKQFDTDYNFTTILGKPIPKSNIKTSFNAIIQGSIAEAMQHTLCRIGSSNPNIIVTEVHDSLILASRPSQIKTVINTGKTVMIKPFHGILDRDLIFPIRVSVGTKWKRWKLLESYRG
ncbi:MAG: hypothetical protein GF411_13840 [Candidatus Lokiarchaeota archaeon]|nr:hypothetical protein [Candidatus Lokiarchaeota archaeon]